MRHSKREGDGATPVGCFRLVKGYWRADRLERMCSALPLQQLRPGMGWCDAPGHRLYNRLVELPISASHEKMMRVDSAYDVVFILDFNLHPRRQHGGSAIFLHLIRDGAIHTEGCIALSLKDMRKLMPILGPKTFLQIGLSHAPRK